MGQAADGAPSDAVGPRRPGARTRRVNKAQASVQTGRGNTAQTGKKLVIRRNTQHADRSPLPLKLRCLKAVDEYNHRSRIRKDAQLRRHQEEVADREAHRKEMMALIAKRMHRKGSQPAFRAAPVQHLPMQQLHASGDGRIDASAANEGRLDTATALDRNRIFERVGIHKIPVEVGGQAKDIDINSCTDLRAFYEAVKNKFGQQIKPEGMQLIYSVSGPTSAFRKVLLNKMTPWRHFLQNAERVESLQPLSP